MNRLEGLAEGKFCEDSIFFELTLTHVVILLQDNDLSEFDESREIIQNLVDEYKACESADYIKWGMEVCQLPHLFLPLTKLKMSNLVSNELLLCRIEESRYPVKGILVGPWIQE